MNRIMLVVSLLLLACVHLGAQTSSEVVLSMSPSPYYKIPSSEVKQVINEDQGAQDKARIYNANYSERAVDTKTPERKGAVEGRTTKTDRPEADENNEFPDVIKNQSMIRLGRLAHVQISVDHDSLNLPVIRTHQYREVHQVGSFGPGVFFQYDIKLKIDGGSQNSTRVFSPMDTVEIIVRDSDLDGIGISSRSNSIRSLSYYDTAFNRLVLTGATPTAPRTTDIALAKSAVLTTWANERFYFELVDLAGDGSDVRGRLRRIEDASGILVNCFYQYGRNAALQTLDRSALFRLSRVTGGGETLRFEYTDDLVGNAYAITGIKVKGRGWIRYAYGDVAKDLTPEVGDDLTLVNTNWDAATNPIIQWPSTVNVFGLSRIDYPEGDASTFATCIDWDSRCSMVRMSDVKDINQHHDKEVFLNLSVWWPDNGIDDAIDDNFGWEEFELARADADPTPTLIRQADNLVRMVVDVPRNRVTFFSWYGHNQDNLETIFYYQEDDEHFHQPCLAQFAGKAGYPYYTQYASTWWQQSYENYGSLLDTTAMVWGSKEGYSHNTWHWVTKYTGDLGRNGAVSRSTTTGLIANGTLPHTAPVWRD